MSEFGYTFLRRNLKGTDIHELGWQLNSRFQCPGMNSKKYQKIHPHRNERASYK